MFVLAAFTLASALQVSAALALGGAAFWASNVLSSSAYMTDRPRLKWYWDQYFGPALCLAIIASAFVIPMLYRKSWRDAPLPRRSIPALPTLDRRPGAPRR